MYFNIHYRMYYSYFIIHYKYLIPNISVVIDGQYVFNISFRIVQHIESSIRRKYCKERNSICTIRQDIHVKLVN